MFAALKQLISLGMQSKKIWLLPILLFFLIITLLVISAQLSPLPVFLYPIL